MKFKLEQKQDKACLYFITNKISKELYYFELDNSLLDQIDELILSLEKEKEKIKFLLKQKEFEPEKYWERLKDLTNIEDMAGLFNSLTKEHRRKLAEYILSQVNIFKGAGALFVEHYNPQKAILGLEPR